MASSWKSPPSGTEPDGHVALDEAPDASAGSTAGWSYTIVVAGSGPRIRNRTGVAGWASAPRFWNDAEGVKPASAMRGLEGPSTAVAATSEPITATKPPSSAPTSGFVGFRGSP